MTSCASTAGSAAAPVGCVLMARKLAKPGYVESPDPDADAARQYRGALAQLFPGGHGRPDQDGRNRWAGRIKWT